MPVRFAFMWNGWGAHAPSRAVFRALAEHFALANPIVFENANTSRRPARARIGTREGACAPRMDCERKLENPRSSMAHAAIGELLGVNVVGLHELTSEFALIARRFI